MESQRYSLKLFAAEPVRTTEKEYILFFHRLIQESALPETCVDVTDYSHVPGGPGVMLICHEAHYSMDGAGGRLGLKCATRRGARGDVATRLRRVLGKTLTAAAAAEAHDVFEGRFRLATGSLLFTIEDRLAAPSSPETLAALSPVLSEVLSHVWGSAPSLSLVSSPKECFQVAASFQSSPPVAELLTRAV